MTPSDVENSPYVSFYRQHSIAPGSKDPSSLDCHQRRRELLYRQLGLAPRLIAGTKVLEFGPGQGNNSIYTASCNPSRYVLVDASEEAITLLRHNLAPYWESAGVEVVTGFFEEYTTEEKFDVVIAEGCLPFQVNPVRLLKKISSFVAPGGVLLVTCISPISTFSEVIRRLLRDRVMRPDAPPEKQLAVLKPILESHLRHLKGFSRTADDWIVDAIAQPFMGPTLSISDAVFALAENFDFYGSSPRFFTDLRWYREAIEEPRARAQLVIEQCHRHALNFLDYRLNLPMLDPGLGDSLSVKCQAIWDWMQQIENGGGADDSTWDEIVSIIEGITTLVEPHAPDTARALREASAVLAGGRIDVPMPAFERLWGRGQQFVSFTAQLT